MLQLQGLVRKVLDVFHGRGAPVPLEDDPVDDAWIQRFLWDRDSRWIAPEEPESASTDRRG